MFRKRKEEPEESIVCAAVIANSVTSMIYQDILRENNIRFICQQPGAGGYMKILTGGLLTSDSIYVKEKDLEQAKELYEVFLNSEAAVPQNDDEE